MGPELRRLGRRVARRRGSAGVAVGFVVAGALVVSNALWDQQERHPAPLWGKMPTQALAAHGGDGTRPIPSPAARPVGAVVAAPEASSMVLAVQEQLAAADYYDGSISGVMDAPTVAAIEAFEVAQGMPVTGEPNLALLSALSAANTAAPAPASQAVLSVLEAQRRLNAKGYGPLDEDGKIGPRTRGAMDRFAGDAGLSGASSRDVLRALAMDDV